MNNLGKVDSNILDLKDFSWVSNCPFIDSTGQIKLSFKLLQDAVVIWQKPAPEKVGSFIIPDEWREDYREQMGIVIAVGRGYWEKKQNGFERFCPTVLKSGDIVVFDKTTPWRFQVTSLVDGKEYSLRFMGEKDIRFLVVDGD